MVLDLAHRGELVEKLLRIQRGVKTCVAELLIPVLHGQHHGVIAHHAADHLLQQRMRGLLSLIGHGVATRSKDGKRCAYLWGDERVPSEGSGAASSAAIKRRRT